MTNEELALKIKAGDNSLQEELWLQIKDFVALMAGNYCVRYDIARTALGLEVDDLIQAGYFAMLDAIKAFPDNSEFKFLTYMKYPLMKAFNALLKRDVRLSKETESIRTRIEYAASLDAQIGNSDKNRSDSYTISDVYPDPLAAQAFENVEDNDCLEQLRADLNKALCKLPKQQALCIRQHYFNDNTYAYIAKILCKSESYVANLIHTGLLSLRRCADLQDYRQKQIERAYAGGMGSWKATGSSIQERIVMNIDEQERRLKNFLQSVEDFCNIAN